MERKTPCSGGCGGGSFSWHAPSFSAFTTASNGGSLTTASNVPARAAERVAGSEVTLRSINAVAWTGLITLSATLAYAVVAGNFSTDGQRLLENPWGLATLVDVYVGFALFSCWIAWREARVELAVVWICLLLIGGNIVSTIYILLAAYANRENTTAFWMGTRRESRMSPGGRSSLEKQEL